MVLVFTVLLIYSSEQIARLVVFRLDNNIAVAIRICVIGCLIQSTIVVDCSVNLRKISIHQNQGPVFHAKRILHVFTHCYSENEFANECSELSNCIL